MMSLSDIYRVSALIFGVIFIIVGILGFILNPTSGALLGIFAVNVIHNAFHLLVGILGIIAAYTGWSRLFIRVFGVVYLILGIIGFLPFLVFSGNLLGLVSINLADNLLHLVVGLIATYIGFAPQFSRQTTSTAA